MPDELRLVLDWLKQTGMLPNDNQLTGSPAMIIGELTLRFIAPDETTDARAQELYDLLAPVVLDIESYAVVRLTNARIEDAKLEGVQLITVD
jgi:hypothetical protein